MFSAHLVFADINDHSSLATPERVDQLESFWSICERHRPPGMEDNPHSFFDIDNDSLMAGFSDLGGMIAGEDVLDWTLRLQTELLISGVSVSFAVNLIACRGEIDWSVCQGFVNDPSRLYIPDDVFERNGRVIRKKIVGDALIATSRLLELAKLIPCPVIFSTFQGGHVGRRPRDIFPNQSHPGVHVVDAKNEFNLLAPRKADWLTQHKISAYGLIADARNPA